MTDSDVTRAERIAGKRAILFFLMAAALLATGVFAGADVDSPVHLAVWLAMASLIALNLTPLPFRWRGGRLRRLLDDEGTREHRRNSFEAGFWTAIGAAVTVAIVSSSEPLAGPVAARVIITAALTAALISFGVQERRAAA